MSVPGGQDSYEFGGFRLDPARRQLYGRDGEAIVIRTKVFDILLCLVERSGQLVTKSELTEAVWPRLVVEENNLNQAVSALRQCLGDDRQSPRFIATVTGRGYQFVAPVRRVPTGGADGPILGTEPRWSMDETRVFFRRPSGRANHNTLWVADADGSDVRMLFEFGPFDVELSDSYFGVTDDDQIVWNQYDPADTEEIWVAGAGD